MKIEVEEELRNFKKEYNYFQYTIVESFVFMGDFNIISYRDKKNNRSGEVIEDFIRGNKGNLRLLYIVYL